MIKLLKIWIILNFVFLVFSKHSKISKNAGKKTKIGGNSKSLDAGSRKSKKTNLLKYRRSEKEITGNNPMLLPEASKGFERAIEGDIEELNNPIINGNYRKDNIPQNSDDRNISLNFLNNQSHPRLNQSDAETYDSKNPFDLVSQTALHYSNFISEELRIISEMQSAQINCKDNNENCSSTTETSNNGDGGDRNYTNGDGNSSFEEDNEIIKCNQWSAWGPCNDTCSNGVTTRYRDCFDRNNNKRPQHDIKSCSNSECLYCTEWSLFSQCDKVCGSGTRYQTRNCFFKNGSTVSEKREEPCNFVSCLPQCDDWSDWTDCSKPCDSGVSVRKRNCSLADGTNKTFYEHQSCNTQSCSKSKTDSSSSEEGNDIPNRDRYLESDDDCISAFLTFDRHQFNVQTVFDETDEHNDVKYNGMVLFEGNQSCGYSGALTGNSSYIEFYDDIFLHFNKTEFTYGMWLTPLSTPTTDGKVQTLFSFESKENNFGKYKLYLTEERKLVFDVITNSTQSSIKTNVALENQRWYHIGVVFSEKMKMQFLYLNGHRVVAKKSGIQENASSQADHDQSYKPQVIGNDPTLSTPFSGLIDEIRIFKCAMKKSDVVSIANTCEFRDKSGCPSPLQGLCNPEHKEREIDQNSNATPLNFQF